MQILHSELCEMGARPLLVDGLFRKILTEYFSQAENLEYETFKTKLYSEAIPQNILIETNYKYDPLQTEKRPAIIIKRGQWQIQPGGTFGSLSSMDPDTLAPTRTHFWQGSHQFLCISKAPAEANMLGAEVARFFLHFGQKIRVGLNMHRFLLTNLSEISKIPEAKDAFAVVVEVQYIWEESFTIYEK